METDLRYAHFAGFRNFRTTLKNFAALQKIAQRLPTAIAMILFMAGLPVRAEPEDLRARGAYLAMITGCVGCHSPRTDEGNVLGERLLTGGNHPIAAGALGRLYPPNITPDLQTGIGSWSADEIINALKEGRTPDGRILSSAMPWRSQFNKLEDTDAEAIAIYLKSLPPVANRVPPPIPAAVPSPVHPVQ